MSRVAVVVKDRRFASRTSGASLKFRSYQPSAQTYQPKGTASSIDRFIGRRAQSRTFTEETLGALGKAGEMAERLVPGGSPMLRAYPAWLKGWVSLCEKAAYKWLDDRA